MCLTPSSTIRLFLTAVLCASPGPLLAGADDPGSGDEGRAGSPIGAAGRQDVDAAAQARYVRDTSRSAEIDWGTGGVAVRGSRLRSGLKRPDFFMSEASWRRGYESEARVWGDIAPDLALEAGATLTRDRNGQNGAALLTHRTGGTARSASLGLRAYSGAALSLTAFDRYGWSTGEPASMAERLNNGEGPARRGFALEWSREDASTGKRLALVLERASTPAGEAANAARVSLEATF